MIETTGAVVVLTLATSTHTAFAAPPNWTTHCGSIKFSPAQSSTLVHAVVVTLVPSGPLGDAQIESTYAKSPLMAMDCSWFGKQPAATPAASLKPMSSSGASGTRLTAWSASETLYT